MRHTDDDDGCRDNRGRWTKIVHGFLVYRVVVGFTRLAEMKAPWQGTMNKVWF